MTRYILPGLLLSISVFARDDKNLILAEPEISTTSKNGVQPDEYGVYEMIGIHVIPEYSSGVAGFYKFVNENVEVPRGDEASVERVHVSFIVEKDGSLSDIKIIKDLGYGLAEQVLKAVRLSAKWKPGINNGEPVRVRYELPFVFRIKAK